MRRSEVDDGGPEGGVRVLSVAQTQGGPSELEVSALRDGRVQGRLPWSASTITGEPGYGRGVPFWAFYFSG